MGSRHRTSQIRLVCVVRRLDLNPGLIHQLATRSADGGKAGSCDADGVGLAFKKPRAASGGLAGILKFAAGRLN